MSAYENCNTTAAKGVARLLPFIKERAHDGQLVVTNKGPLAPFLQKTVGDVVINTDPERIWTIEIKTEEKHTGNLFLEYWSNLNLEERRSHAERGTTPGWLHTLRADLIFFYFLDTDDLYIFNLFRLQQWALREREIYKFPLKRQKRHLQANDTHGHIVPISDLRRHIGFRHAKVSQLELSLEAA